MLFLSAREQETYMSQAVETCKELVQHPHQFLCRQRGREVCEAFNVCEKNAE